MPSFTPRSERMTVMKWMQEDRRSGRDVDFVRSYYDNQPLGFARRKGVAYADIDMRDIANNVVLGVKNWK